MSFNVLLSGVGGQGVVSAADAIAEAAIRDELRVRCADDTGVAQRGGGVNSHVKIGYSVASPVIYPGTADVGLGFEPVEGVRWAHMLKPGGLMILNSRRVLPVTVKAGLQSFPDVTELSGLLGRLGLRTEWIDASGLAERAGSPLTLNSVMLGLLSGVLGFPIETDTLREVIMEKVPKKVVGMNFKAFEAACAIHP